jgi:hypothetical protein
MAESATSDLPVFGPPYLDPAILRYEISAMAEAFIAALLGAFPAGSVEAVYGKGSAFKAWDSPIDYVPEVSDVDLHVLFADGRPENEKSIDLETALAVEARTTAGYRSRIKDAFHVPRLQFIPIKWMEAQPSYVPSPAGTVKVLLGSNRPGPGIDLQVSLENARGLLLEQREFLGKLGDQVIDKPAGYKREVVRQMAWRVSPTGPRVLEVLGIPFERAWAGNRTTAVRLLRSVGEDDLAANYASFYLHAWEYYLSSYGDGESAGDLIRSGSKILRGSIAIAEAAGR